MNRIQRIGLLLAVLAGMVLSSCKKEKSLENGNGGPLGPETWEFKEGASFKGPIDTAYYSTLGGVTSLILEGVSTDLRDDFYLEILGASITTGTYATPTVVFEYYSNGTLLYHNDPAELNKFSVIITEIDGSGVSGTFSGEVKDSSGNVKNITDGKFTGKFNTVTVPPPPNPTTCKLSNLASYALGNGAKISAITSYFNAQNEVTKTQLLDSSSQTSGILEHEFNFTYAASRIDVDANQYFGLEPGGRINQFHGFADPTSDTSLEVIITYTYDAGGYLSGASLALTLAPSIPVFTYVYEWMGGNLAKVTINIISGEKSVIDYQYDPAKPAKGFLSFHTNPEILLFQNVINFGKNSANVPTKSTWTDYDGQGAVIGTPVVSNFTNYVYDTNSYIKSFDITGDGSVYGSEIRHVLSYKCF
jgi:hypothetical protein